VRYVGASNYVAWQLARANAIAEVRGLTPFVSVQNHYHMFEREQEREVIPYCNAHNVGILPFFPLAGGFLTGKYKRGEPAPAGSRGESSAYVQQYMTEANYDKVEKMTAWAAERNRSMNELAHAWLLAQPSVRSVISGATGLAQLQENIKAADWQLSAEELSQVNAVLGS
jgi:aryl-alcohol dehydrogenase-like predicted oxidoreductase